MPAIPAIIAGGAAIAQGVIGSRAARGAARTQADATRDIYNLANLAGERSARDITETGEQVAEAIGAAGREAGSGVRQTAEQGAAGLRIGADEANSILRAIYGDIIDQLGPYRSAGADAIGTLSAALGPEGEFNRRFTLADLALDPGYDFRLQQGQKALERSAAARGGVLSGATLQALTNYSQNVASDEFSRAFDRFRTDRADRFAMLSDLAGRGQRATETGVGAGLTYARDAAGNVTNAAAGGANLRYRGAADEGDFLTRSTGAAGGVRLGAIGDASRFRMDAARIGANALAGGADATAAGQIGSGNAWSTAIGRLGSLGEEHGPALWTRLRRRRSPTGSSPADWEW